MGDNDFQTAIFNRLAKLEQGQAAMMSMLEERCSVRNETLQRHEAAIQDLVAAEHRQIGERRVFAGLLTILGIIGGIAGSVAVRFLSSGGR